MRVTSLATFTSSQTSPLLCQQPNLPSTETKINYSASNPRKLFSMFSSLHSHWTWHRWLCAILVHILPDESHLPGHMELLLVGTMLPWHWRPSRLSTRTASVLPIYSLYTTQHLRMSCRHQHLDDMCTSPEAQPRQDWAPLHAREGLLSHGPTGHCRGCCGISYTNCKEPRRGTGQSTALHSQHHRGDPILQICPLQHPQDPALPHEGSSTALGPRLDYFLLFFKLFKPFQHDSCSTYRSSHTPMWPLSFATSTVSL